MGRQLNVRSDEAYAIAHKVAVATGKPLAEIVIEALRDYGSRITVEGGLTATQRADVDALRAAGRRAAARMKPGVSVDDVMNDMYDENGLPR